MSYKVAEWVWEHSRSRYAARLVLLAIADNAHDGGDQAWPSIATLVRKTGLGERSVHRAIKQLVELGELEVKLNAGPGLCNLYRIRMDPRQSGTPADMAPLPDEHPRQSGTPADMAATPADMAPEPPQIWHPEPSVEPSENHKVLTPLSVVPTDDRDPADILDVWDTWKASTGKQRADLNPARRRAITKALAAYPTGDVLDAVQGWANDPWPERPQHNDITQLLHMGTTRKPLNVLEKMRDLCRDGPPSAPHSTPTRRLLAEDARLAHWAQTLEGGEHAAERMAPHRGQARRELPRPSPPG